MDRDLLPAQNQTPAACLWVTHTVGDFLLLLPLHSIWGVRYECGHIYKIFRSCFMSLQ